MPEARHNNSKLAEMLVSASCFSALVGIAVDVVSLFMALLSSVESAPEPTGSRRATPPLLFQHRAGQFRTALAHLRRAYGLAKLPYVEDVVMSRRGGASPERTPTLIFNTYRMTGDRLEALLSEQGIVVGRIHGDTSAAERHAVVTGIQDGSVETAILQIDAAGSALNLQAANRIIMLEPSWTPGANHQAAARAVRIGQRNPVLISWPIVRHSIDEAVMRALRRKQDGLTKLWRTAS